MTEGTQPAASEVVALSLQRDSLLRMLTALEWAPAAMAMLLALVLSLPNLGLNPAISYDEGYVLQAPHKLLTDGFYGTRSLDDRVPFDPHITTGPTVLLPVWAMFTLFGPDLTVARGVVVLYGMLTVAAAYLLTRVNHGKWVALLAAVLVAFSLYPYNRTVLGEVPALFWALAGAWLWAGSLQGRVNDKRLILGALCFGLAALTKLAFLPILGLTLLLVLGGAWLIGRRPRPSLGTMAITFLGLGLPLCLWYGLQVALLGPAESMERLLAVGSYQDQFFAPSQQNLSDNLGTFVNLVPGGLVAWLAPAALLAGLRLVTGDLHLPTRSFIPLLLLSSLSYYVLSVGWARYAFWAVALAAMVVAPLAAAFVSMVMEQTKLAGAQARLGVAAVVALALLAPVAWSFPSTVGKQDGAAFATAAFIKEVVGDGEVIGSTEREMDFLTRMNALYPPTYVATVSRGSVQSSFDWTWPGVDWVVTGGIGKFLGAEDRLQRHPNFVLRMSSGQYRVFQRETGPSPGWRWDTRDATAVLLSGDRATVGQTFSSPYRVLTEVRVLLAGEGRTDNASVTLNLYDSPTERALLASASIEGSEIKPNTWYTFPLGKTLLDPGKKAYFELVSRPEAGRRPVSAWINGLVDHYQDGQWYQDNIPQEGDVYFGVLGHNK